MAQKQHTAESSAFSGSNNMPHFFLLESAMFVQNSKLFIISMHNRCVWHSVNMVSKYSFHAMKACRESRNIALLHLNLGARWSPTALAPGKDPSTHRIREGLGLRVILGILMMKHSDLPKNIFKLFPVLYYRPNTGYEAIYSILCQYLWYSYCVQLHSYLPCILVSRTLWRPSMLGNE